MKKMITCSLIFVAQIALAQRSEITLSSAIEVSPREKITAYDLVETKNLTDENMTDLKDIELADADTKNISKIELIKKFRSLKSSYRFPSEVKILRSKSNVSRLEVERKIKNHLLSKCGICDYTVQINSVPQVLATDWIMDMNVDLNKATVMIPIYSAAAAEKKGWVVAEIKKYAAVPVLNRSLKMGDVIAEEALTVEKRLITSYQDYINDSKSIVGMQAARFLSTGQMLTSRDLKREQIMKKGQMVKATFGDGSFEVSITAQVEENGAIGDVIKVKNLDSQKMFAAKIVDRGLVKIE